MHEAGEDAVMSLFPLSESPSNMGSDPRRMLERQLSWRDVLWLSEPA